MWIFETLRSEFLRYLQLVDASNLAGTCRGLRGIYYSLVVKDGKTLDISRLSKGAYKVFDDFVLNILTHIKNLRSIEGRACAACAHGLVPA